MKRLVLSTILAGAAILAIAGSAFAQVAPPPVTPGTFMATVTGTDAETGAQGIWVSEFVQDLDAQVADLFGWRPTRPATIVLYPDATAVELAAEGFMGRALTETERNVVLQRAAFAMRATQPGDGVQAGNWVILVNIDTGLVGGATPMTDAAWRMNIQESLARQYAFLMEQDVVGEAGPQWLRQGLADTVAFKIVPGTPTQSRLMMAVVQARNTDTLPSLGDIDENSDWFRALAPGGPIPPDVARGVAFLAANTLLDRVGGKAIPSILTRTRGENLGSVLESAGISFDQLNDEYRLRIP